MRLPCEWFIRRFRAEQGEHLYEIHGTDRPEPVMHAPWGIHALVGALQDHGGLVGPHTQIWGIATT